MRTATAGRSGRSGQGSGRLADAPTAALVPAARQGDQDALAELYRRVWPRALAAVRRRCGWDEAEDAVAEGFARALDRLDQIRDPAAAEAWLTQSAVRSSLDLARRRRRAQPSGGAGELPKGRTPDGESAVERLLTQLDHAAVASSVKQLPGDLQHLVRLRYVDGLSIAEIAVVLGRPEGTVRRRCFDACRLIEQRFLRHQLGTAIGECAVVTEQLCRSLSRSVSPRTRHRIDQHLRACTRCRHRQAELTDTVAELDRRRRHLTSVGAGA